MLTRSTMRAALPAFLTLFVTLSLPAAAQAGKVTDTASFDNCHDQANFLSVPKSSAKGRVPKDYKVKSDDDETVYLTVAIHNCDVTIGDANVSVRATWTAVGFVLDTADDDGKIPETTDHGGFESGIGTDSGHPLLEDVYLLFMVSDSKPLADWLRLGTGLKTTYVPDMVRTYQEIPALQGQPCDAPNFVFDTPSPTPSPFKVCGRVTAQKLQPIYVDVNFWQDTKMPDGKTWRLKLRFPSHADYLAPADVIVDAEDETEMAEIIGTSPDGCVGCGKDLFASSILIDHYDGFKTKTVVHG